ncbi:gamma-aminobutyric acid type B receptor subunit 2-like [Amphiura filiformis]|uniref:gamma-aminobutyric acid type B receptor subunit 2-like n=1 Tax=Amphiura filiformis TaxID=82378 RepID=UPI003B211773
MLIALALNQSIDDLRHLNRPRNLEDFNYEDEEMTRIFNYNVRHVEFTGISGLMKTNTTRDRKGQKLIISQYVDQRRNLILSFDENGENSSRFEIGIKWAGNFIPVDGKTYRNEIVLIGSWNRIVILTLTSFGIVLALVFLFINIRYRKERAIKMTSPIMNTFMLTGGILMYASVHYICTSVGFTLGMGTLCLKTYRVYAIFKNSNKGVKINLTDRVLVRCVFALAAIDLAMICVWILVDPLFILDMGLEAQFDTTEPEKEIYTIPVLRQCQSTYKAHFVVFLVLTKVLLLVVGVFLAGKTRNVHYAALNDSKHIGASVYLIAIVAVVTVAVFAISSQNLNTQFTFIGLAMVITTSIVLCKIFVLLKTLPSNLAEN